MHARSFIHEFETHPFESAQFIEALKTTGFEPDLVLAFYGCMIDGAEVADAIVQAFPKAALIGGSSSGGVIDQYRAPGPQSVGLLLIEDANGDYGVGARVLDADPADAAETALRAALDDADAAGELPELIWTYLAPGQEEAAISGLRRVVGDRCPIVGGSAADDDITGKWTQISAHGIMQNGIVVCTLFPSQPLGFAFQGGYEPNGHVGRVTHVDNGKITSVEGANRSRVIVSIDNRPAAEVYNEWTQGAVSHALEGGNILSATNLRPLSVLVGQVDGVDQFLLVHPETIREDGALTTFAELEEGARIFCMRGQADHLIQRAGRVTRQAYSQVEDFNPGAALVVFCGGCRMAIENRMDKLVATLNEQVGDIPLITCFTFGEQGPLMGKNMHGNLMISAVVFGSGD